MSTVGQFLRITPSEAMAKIREGALAVDIRSQAEYRGGHIVGALSLPPEQQRDKLPDDTAPCLIFYCLSGKRTTRAETILSVLGQGRECYILEGGLQAWKAAGLPIVTDHAAPDIMRQVQTIAGSLILLGVLAGWLVSPWFYLIDVMVGAGLLISGLTGFCGMARLLAKMPWNH